MKYVITITFTIDSTSDEAALLFAEDILKQLKKEQSAIILADTDIEREEDYIKNSN